MFPNRENIIYATFERDLSWFQQLQLPSLTHPVSPVQVPMLNSCNSSRDERHFHLPAHQPVKKGIFLWRVKKERESRGEEDKVGESYEKTQFQIQIEITLNPA